MLPLVLLLAHMSVADYYQNDFSDGYFSDWGVIGGRTAQPTCVDIPKNMSLCHNIGYTKMRLPNLLDHDSMSEVMQQAASWVPLLNVRCHLDTQLFLCSLFSPVCLDRPIYPCRGLCERVRAGCEVRMKNYGYPWPDMLKCDKFPLDNDMCITPLSEGSDGEQRNSCEACEQVDTYENILDHFCSSDFVIRAKLRRNGKRGQLLTKGFKVFKTTPDVRDDLKNVKRQLQFQTSDGCCSDVGKESGPPKYLVMGKKRNGELLPTLILPWTKKSKAIRHAVKKFKTFDCADPKIVFAAEGVETLAKPTMKEEKKKKGEKNEKKQNPMRHSAEKKQKKQPTPSPSTTTVRTTTTKRKGNNNNQQRNNNGTKKNRKEMELKTYQEDRLEWR